VDRPGGERPGVPLTTAPCRVPLPAPAQVARLDDIAARVQVVVFVDAKGWRAGQNIQDAQGGSAPEL